MAIETVEQFRQRILDNVTDDIDELPRGVEAAWFNDPVTNTPTKFQINQSVPFDKFSRVVAVFQSDDVIRVYSMPSAPPDPKPADWPTRPPTRYTLTRTAPTYVAEILTLEAMADAISDEWNAVGDANETAAGELETVLEFLAGQDKLIDRDQLIMQLREGAHYDVEEGPGPPEAPPVPAPTQPS